MFRYVREWLNAMVCIGVFDFDEGKKTYFFPKERHSALTLKGGYNEIGVLSQGPAVCMRVYQDLLECFKKDGPRGN